MTWLTNALTSTIGRKVVMSITGLFLISFLVVHLSGNFLLFQDDQGAAFNLYSDFMSTASIVRVAEIILVAGFAFHIYTSYVLTRRNREARPQQYAYAQPSPGVSWFSRNMGLSGSIVLIFLLTHLANFWYRYKFGDPELVLIEGEYYKDMYGLVATAFRKEWWISILYVVAMVLLGFHLNHGFQSAFRTLGLNHPKYLPMVQKLGTAIAILIPAGFASFPLYFLLTA